MSPLALLGSIGSANNITVKVTAHYVIKTRKEIFAFASPFYKDLS